MLDKIISLICRLAGSDSYKILDRLYVPLDRTHIRRTKNIRLIPTEDNRRGGKYSYAEWAHVIGIFQTLMFIHLDKKDGNRILDIGCGTGLIGIASEPFLGVNGSHVGIDVMKDDVEFCRSHYDSAAFEFIHFNVNNAVFAPSQKGTKCQWPVKDHDFDLVTALSVWTHFNEEDALFFIREVNRVLKPGGKAIISVFLMDESYQKSISVRSETSGRYHMTSQAKWIFDVAAYGSDAWFCPQWAQVSESAIGITNAGLDRLISASELELTEHYQGNWKEVPGIFFQDVLVFKKPDELSP